MKNWLRNFLLAFAFWFGFLLIFSWTIFEESNQLQTSIKLDAARLGEFMEENKSALKNFSETKKISEKSAEKFEEKSTQKQNDAAPKQVAPLFNPLPEIPGDLRKEAFESEAIARFYIRAEGDVSKVELIKPCANPRLNSLLLKSLQKWKFPSQAQDFTQEIRVGFKVE